MAAITVQISIALLLLASSDWTAAHKGSDKDGVHATEEGGEGAPTYNFGETAIIAPVLGISVSNACSSVLCCTCVTDCPSQ